MFLRGCFGTHQGRKFIFLPNYEFLLSIKIIQLVTEEAPPCHPIVQRCQNISKDFGGEKGGKRKRKIGSDRSRDRERQREREVEITTKKSPFSRLSLLTFMLSRKASIDPHTPFLSLSSSSTYNLTLHWFALQCSRQATTCKSNYSYRERLGQRKGGRDSGAGNHASRLCLCEARK